MSDLKMSKETAWRMYSYARDEVLAKQQVQQTVLAWTVALFVAGTTAILLINGQLDSSVKYSAVAGAVVLEWIALVCIAVIGLCQYVGEWAGMLRAAAYSHMLESYLLADEADESVPVAPWEHWVRSTEGWMTGPGWISALGATMLALCAQAVPFVTSSAIGLTDWLLVWTIGAVVTLIIPGYYAWDSDKRRNHIEASAASLIGAATEVSGDVASR